MLVQKNTFVSTKLHVLLYIPLSKPLQCMHLTFYVESDLRLISEAPIDIVFINSAGLVRVCTFSETTTHF